MADAKKCDRCGKYYENKNPGFSISRLKYAGDLMGRIEIDLCEDCCEQFNKWLEDKNAIISTLSVGNMYFKPLEPVPEMPTDYKITCCENPCDITNSTIKIKKDE